MKILIIGANGFIGRKVAEIAETEDFEVIRSGIDFKNSKTTKKIDLLDKASIKSALSELKPNYIINCAGTVENSDKAILLNPVFTLNLLQSVIETGVKPKKIIFSGSAGEYGVVGKERLPVKEDTPLLGESFYARSKVMESLIALAYRHEYNLPVIIARIFNPIGPGMHPRFLIPGIINQIKEFKSGTRKSIKVSRLDAFRDYIDIADIAKALVAICKNSDSLPVYNIGSGKKTTNSELIELILSEMKVSPRPKIIETQKTPEQIYAVQADISRITKDSGWKPSIKLSETVKDIMNEYKK